MAASTSANLLQPPLLSASTTIFLLFPSLILAIPTFQSWPSDQIIPDTSDPHFIRTSCSATLYPERCYTSLSGYSNAIQQSPSQLAIVAVTVSLQHASRVSAYMASLSRGASNPLASAVLGDCPSTFGDAIQQMRQSTDELRQLKTGEQFQWQMSNVQTWMSAALTNENTCTDGFQDLPASDVKEDVHRRVTTVTELTSNALALVNSLASKNESPPSQAVDFDDMGF